MPVRAVLLMILSAVTISELNEFRRRRTEERVGRGRSGSLSSALNELSPELQAGLPSAAGTELDADLKEAIRQAKLSSISAFRCGGDRTVLVN